MITWVPGCVCVIGYYPETCGPQGHGTPLLLERLWVLLHGRDLVPVQNSPAVLIGLSVLFLRRIEVREAQSHHLLSSASCRRLLSPTKI